MRVSKRTFHMSFTALAFAICAVSFQNFSSISLADLRPQFNAAQAERVHTGLNDRGNQDIRDFAPARPADFGRSAIAVPDSGKDPGTIGLNWLGKQTNLITDGGDQRLLKELNKKINRLTKFTPVEGEPWPEPGGDEGQTRDPASGTPGAGDDGAQPEMPKNLQDMFSFAPTSVHFSQLNRFELKFAANTQLNCLLGNGGVDLDLQRPITDRMDVGLRHQTANQANTLHLQYNW